MKEPRRGWRWWPLVPLLVILLLVGCASSSTETDAWSRSEEELARQEASKGPGEQGKEDDRDGGTAIRPEGLGSEDEEDSDQEDESSASGEEKENGQQSGSGGSQASSSGGGGSSGSSQATVTISIRGPSDVGTILGPTTVTLESGDTVLQVLQRSTRQRGIHLATRGGGSSAYVEGIRNLYEFDRGPESGWMYSVNGYYPNRGSGAWKLEAGDRIEWRYTLNSGRDLGAAPGG